MLTAVACIGCAAMGGVFFAFSAFVMAGLARLPAGGGVAAMQSINVTAVRPPFMTALFGTAALCGGLVVAAVVARDEPQAPLLLVGGLLYLVGTIALTVGYHVPRNDELAALDPALVGTDALAAEQWSGYLTSWTRWNHVRALAALAAAATLVAALSVSG